MRRTVRTAIVALAAAMLAIYAISWIGVDSLHIGRSDFTSTFVGASLWNDGHHADLYDLELQDRTHRRFIAPDVEGNLPFVNPPTAAVVVAPLTPLGLHTAYRVFALLQMVLLAGGVILAWLAVRRRCTIDVAVVALAVPGTLAMLDLGQWDGIAAFGIGAGYFLLTRERPMAAGAVLASGILVAKPHLGLGIAAFLLAWGQIRVVVGAVIAALAFGLGDLLAVGPAGLHGYASIEFYDASRWNLAAFLGFNGFFDSWLANATLSQTLGWVCTAIALGCTGLLGWSVRRGKPLGLGLAGTVALSLVASPHLLSQDLVLLCPAFVLAVAAWRRTATVYWVWLGLCVAGFADLGNQSPAPPGRLVPVVLAATGGAILVAVRRLPDQSRGIG